jgi:REP element-mobilizing transposase RayT
MQPKKEHYRRKLPHYQQPGQWYSVTIILKGAMPKGAMEKYSLEVETARNRLQQLEAAASPGVGLSRSGKKGIGLSKSDIFDLGKSKSPGNGVSNSVNSELRNSESRLAQAKKEYQIALRKYRLAYDKILNKSNLPGISLIKKENRKVIEEALMFWEGKRLTNHAWCIMSNHFHWVFTVFEKEVEPARESDFPKSDKISDLGKSESRELEFPNSNSLSSETQSPTAESEFPNSDIKKPVYLQDILHSIKLYTARQINKNENRKGQLWEHESFDTTIRNDKHFYRVVEYTLNNPVSAGLVKDWNDWPGTRCFLTP